MNKFLISCLALVLVLFLAVAIPGPLAAGEGSRADCYPTNAFPMLNATGPTWASGEAQGTLEEVEVERHNGDVTPDLIENVKVQLEFNAKITGANTTNADGASTGRAEVTFNWLTHNSPLLTGINKTVFHAGCAQEIETDHQDGAIKIGEFEGEYEGTVENFPGYPNTSKAAVLSVMAHEDPDNPGRFSVEFNIELGYTCFENVYQGTTDDIEFDKITLKNLEADEFHINNVGRHGRASLPDPVLFGNCPDVGFGL